MGVDFSSLVAGTTIDGATLLSTDYFNAFNEIIMLLGMVAELPEMIEEIKAWRFRSYQEHFRTSSLPFAPLAIALYAKAPEATRTRFESTIATLRGLVEEIQDCLSGPLATTGGEPFGRRVLDYSARLQQLVEAGSAIVHGASQVSDQNAVDRLF